HVRTPIDSGQSRRLRHRAADQPVREEPIAHADVGRKQRAEIVEVSSEPGAAFIEHTAGQLLASRDDGGERGAVAGGHSRMLKNLLAVLFVLPTGGATSARNECATRNYGRASALHKNGV